MPRCPRDGETLALMTEDPLVGVTLADKYLVEALVGEGAMGRVYRARHVRLGRVFAVKVMYGDLAAQEIMRKRFAREARLASRLSHRNVVPILDYGVEEGSVAFHVMDFVEGLSLGDVLDAGPIDAERTTQITLGIARGLRHAHESGLVHRDLKPDNVMLVREDGEEVPKIVDFGIAVLSDEDGHSRLTRSGHIVGTPAFMAPEQAFGENVDGRTDLYALGGVIYACLSGRPPFTGDASSVLQRKMAFEAPDIHDHVADVPARLAELVARLLERSKDDRPASAAEVIAHLEGEDESAAPSPPEASRHRAAIAGALLIVLLSGGALVWNRESSDAAEPRPRLVELPSAADEVAPLDLAPEETAEAPSEPPAPAPEAAPPAPTVTEPPPPAKARVSRRRRAPEPKRAAPKPEPEPTRSPPPPTVDPLERLTQLYVEVGERLQRAEGADVEPLRKRYFAIPYADALRVPSVRSEALAELTKLRAALKPR